MIRIKIGKTKEIILRDVWDEVIFPIAFFVVWCVLDFAIVELLK